MSIVRQRKEETQGPNALLDTATILALAHQDLGRLSAAQQATLLREMCARAGIPVELMPIQLLRAKNRDGSERTVPYITAAGAHYLAHRDHVSVRILDRQTVEGIHLVRAEATSPDGRLTQATGAVSVEGLRGEPFANALMKAETKAFRRAILRLCGLAFLDETETASVPDAQPVEIAYAPDAVCLGTPAETGRSRASDPAGSDGGEGPGDRGPAGSNGGVAMRALHAKAKGKFTHDQLSQLTRQVFGVPSMRDVTAEQLDMLRAAVEECATPEDAQAFMPLAGAIDEATTPAALQRAAAAIAGAKTRLGEGARMRLLRIAYNRVREALETQPESDASLDGAGPETAEEDPLVSWSELWRLTGEPLGVRSLADAARHLGVPEQQLRGLTPAEVKRLLESR